MIDVSRIARNNVTLFATLLPRAMVVAAKCWITKDEVRMMALICRD